MRKVVKERRNGSADRRYAVLKEMFRISLTVMTFEQILDDGKGSGHRAIQRNNECYRH